MTAFEWATSQTPTEPPSDFYCATSDMWQGRFTKMAPLIIKQGIDQNFASLITAVIGEIGDNCFAHNTPNWIDIPGCWLEWSANTGTLKCIIADRGRGIFSSLKAVRPSLQDDNDALQVAFTERVSGRAPEKRGNGLKFAVDALRSITLGSFLLQSGKARFSAELPLDPNRIEMYIKAVEIPLRGVYSELHVRML